MSIHPPSHKWISLKGLGLFCIGSFSFSEWLMNYARRTHALCFILLFSAKQAMDLTLDAIIMQFVSFFILFAFITAWSFHRPFSQNLKLSSTYKLSWCGGRHSQTKMTPPQPNSCLQISRSLCRLETMTYGCTGVPSLLLPSLQDSQTGISSCDESQAVTAQRSRACHLWLRQIYSRS